MRGAGIDLDLLASSLASPETPGYSISLGEIRRGRALLEEARGATGSEALPDLDGLHVARFLRANATAAATLSSPSDLRRLRAHAEQILAEDVEGDWCEVGTWRGGRALFLRAVLAAHGDRTRRVVLVDSFQGAPPLDPQVDPDDALLHHILRAAGSFAVSSDAVRDLFRRHGLLDDRVVFLEGRIEETLPQEPKAPLSLLLLDVNSRAATSVALHALCPRLSPGAVVMVDDYQLGLGSRRAVDAFLAESGRVVSIQPSGSQAGWWRAG